MEELKKYIEALKAARNLTDTLPYNVPEKLEEFCEKMENKQKKIQTLLDTITKEMLDPFRYEGMNICHWCEVPWPNESPHKDDCIYLQAKEILG